MPLTANSPRVPLYTELDSATDTKLRRLARERGTTIRAIIASAIEELEMAR